MRIAYLINQYPKVSHSFIRREIQALEKQGVEIMRISLRGWDLELADLDDIKERDQTRFVLKDGAFALLPDVVRTLMTRPIRFFRAWSLAWWMGRQSNRPRVVHLAYLAEACRIERWLRGAEMDHLHAHFGTNSAEVAMLVNVLGGPTWSFTVHGPEEFDKAPVIGLAEKIRRANLVIAISSYGRSQLFRMVEMKHWKKIKIIHCGVNASFHSIPLSDPPASPRLVCVGRLAPQKGHLLLVEAARRLAADGVAVELVFAGDGEMRDQIEAEVTRAGLNERVHVTGWVSGERVREELLAARALVLPSFAEGLPVVIMEAMALRRPVISTFVAGIPELVRPGIDGWLVPAGDLDGLVEAMRACLAASADTLVHMGQNARTRVLDRHDIEGQAELLSRLFAAMH